MRNKIHNQEIFFENGFRRTIYGVTRVERGTWWHIFTKDAEYIINPDKVLFVRVTDTKPSDKL